MVKSSAMRFIAFILQYITGVLLFIIIGSLPVLLGVLPTKREYYTLGNFFETKKTLIFLR